MKEYKDYYHLLLIVAGIFAIAGLCKPQWPLTAIAVLLIVIALFGH